MIASIVGNYLRDVGLLTEEQLHDLLAEHRKALKEKLTVKRIHFHCKTF